MSVTLLRDGFFRRAIVNKNNAQVPNRLPVRWLALVVAAWTCPSVARPHMVFSYLYHFWSKMKVFARANNLSVNKIYIQMLVNTSKFPDDICDYNECQYEKTHSAPERYILDIAKVR